MSTLVLDNSVVTENIVQHHEEVFYQSAEFWVAAAFVLVVCLLAGTVYKTLKAMIKKRIKRIKDELGYAENLKLDAQKLYAEYERKYINTDKEVLDIIANEKSIIEENKERKLAAMKQWLKQKNLEADAKIEIALEQANNEINNLISKKTLEILRNIFYKKITEKEHQKLIINSIKKMENIIIND